jgi:hypothetical protein
MKINRIILIPLMAMILFGSLYCLSQKNLPGNIACFGAMIGLLIYARR